MQSQTLTSVYSRGFLGKSYNPLRIHIFLCGISAAQSIASFAQWRREGPEPDSKQAKGLPFKIVAVRSLSPQTPGF